MLVKGPDALDCYAHWKMSPRLVKGSTAFTWWWQQKVLAKTFQLCIFCKILIVAQSDGYELKWSWLYRVDYVHFQRIEREPKWWHVQCFLSNHWKSINFMIDFPENETNTQIWVSFKTLFILSNDLLEPLSNVSHSDNSANVDTIWIQEWSSMLFHWRDPVLEGKFFFTGQTGPNLLVRWTVRTRWVGPLK